MQRVLAGEDAEGGRAAHRDAEIGKKNLPPVIEHCIETLKDGLTGQVELVKKDPVTCLEGLAEEERKNGSERGRQ